MFPLLAALLLALFLAACGGSEEPTAELPQPTTAGVAEEILPSEPVEEPAAEAEPTEQPAAAPTEQPAAAPTEEAAEEPAAEVEPTDLPGPILTIGDCGNKYYPIVDGRVLTYRNNMAELGESTYTMSFSDVSPTDFTVTTGVEGEDLVSTTWHCTGDGMLSTTFNQTPGMMEGMEIQFVEAEGVTIPLESSFEPGESWTTRYTANVTTPDMGLGPVNMVQKVELTHTVIGVESVSVPAGDFPDAVRVETTGTVNMDMAAGGQSAPGMAFNLNFTSWYAEGVGLVRQETTQDSVLGMFGTSISELVSVVD